VDSTQDWVRSNIQDLPNRSVVSAVSQTMGKGRLGRVWASPPGGLYASILFKPAPVPEYASRVSLAIAAVLVRSLEKRGISGMVKWPNDVLAGGGKLAGILAEAGGHPAPWLILGVGVNLCTAPTAVGKPCLPAVHWGLFGTPPGASALLDEILSGLDEVWPIPDADPLARVSGILDKSLWMKDRVVKISAGREAYRGVLKGISRDGGLLIDVGTGERVFYSGELSPE